jgi:hypothetical protein
MRGGVQCWKLESGLRDTCEFIRDTIGVQTRSNAVGIVICPQEDQDGRTDGSTLDDGSSGIC